jgi:hypothetical protein
MSSTRSNQDRRSPQTLFLVVSILTLQCQNSLQR